MDKSGPLVADDSMNGTIDDEEDDDGFGTRIVKSDLAAGEYTIEATGSLAEISGAFVLSVFGDKVTAIPTGNLNDTGVTVSGSVNANSESCDGVGNFSEQDCNYGRDSDQILNTASSANDEDGINGFSFLKVAMSGAPLPASASNWSCVKDNVTGLMWEVKTDNATQDLFHRTYRYSWYNPDNSTNGGSAGTIGGVGNGSGGSNNSFTGVRCDTSGYITAVNQEMLCGYDDWRLPTMDEIRSIVVTGSPYIDLAFFPHLQGFLIWALETRADNPELAWSANFFSGKDINAGKSALSPTRLVRGGVE